MKKIYQVLKKFFYDICAIFFIMILCIIYSFFLRTINTLDGDAVNGYYAVIAGNARTFMNGDFPLWNPYLWGGHTNAGSIFGCFYPIFYVLYLVFWDYDSQMLSYYFLPTINCINLVIFSCGMYALEKKIINHRGYAWICAVLTTFCGCTLTGYYWTYIFIGFAWIPFFLYAYMNALQNENKKWIVMAAIIMAMVGLGATSHGLIFLGMSMFFLFVSFCVCNRNAFVHYVKVSITIGFLGIGLCAVQLIPFIQSMGLSHRHISSENGILDYAEYMKHTVPASSMHALLGGHLGSYAMSILLFLLAVNAFRRSRKIVGLKLFAMILFVFGICMVSGAFLPDVLWHIPGVNKIRQMHLYSPYIGISCGILAGFSLADLAKLKKFGTKKRITSIDCIIGIFFIIALLPENNTSLYELFIKIIPAAVIFFLYRDINSKWKKIVPVVLCLYTCLDFICYAISASNITYLTPKEANKKVLDVNLTTKREFDELELSKGDRVLSWTSSSTYPSNIASAIGVYDCFAYMNPIYEKNYYVHGLDPLLRSHIQNIKYFFTSENNETSFLENFSAYMNSEPKQTLSLYSGYDSLETSGVLVYKNNTLGNAWIVNHGETYKSSDSYEDVFARLGNIDVGNECLINSKFAVDGYLSKDSNLDSTVVLDYYGTNNIRYKCKTNEQSILVTSEVLYPGWKVYIDGKKQDIVEVNFAFRGCFLEKGNHIVEFKYQPGTVLIGGILSLFSVIICIILILDRECTFCVIKYKRRGYEQ